MTSTPSASVIICGAGIVGVAAAYHLAVRHGLRRVVLVDEREPLTLTSDKGTQAYRNWWPGPDATMLRFVSRSIDLIEESADECGNAFRLSRRGYLFATARDAGVAALRATAGKVASYGMGALREHTSGATYAPAAPEGYRERPDGADLLLGDAARDAFPYLTPETAAVLHVRRAGWLSAVAFGNWLLRRALGAGVEVVRDRVVGIDAAGGAVQGVRLAGGGHLAADRVVLAAGPGLPAAARLLGAELPLVLEPHAKLTIRDVRRTIPRSAPFIIWNDPVSLAWTAGERASLDALGTGDPAARLLDPLPGGVHARPVDGPHGDELWLIWTYDAEPVAEAAWPPRFEPHHGEALVRGLARMVPAFADYAGQAATGVVDGGYYCKTPENRPLIGPLAIDGAFVCGALSGYGIMAAHAAGELLAAHVTGAPLPPYAPAFLPSRYDDPAYVARIAEWGARVGQM